MHTPPPEPVDTNFKPEARNWLEVYRYELDIATQNNDNEAYYFFLQELIKESYYQKTGKRLSPNPPLRFIK